MERSNSPGSDQSRADSLHTWRNSKSRNVELRTLGATALGLAITASCLIVYAIHGSLPHNPIALPLEKELSMRAWAPEGWKFFTRNPKEERPVLFVQRDGQWQRAETGPASRPHYLFGLNRAGRVQGLELGLILEHIPRGAWHNCDKTPLDCISTSATAITVTNRSPRSTLCGSVGLAMQKPIPWSWIGLPRPVVMPSRIVRLKVKC